MAKNDKIKKAQSIIDRAEAAGCVGSVQGNFVVWVPPLSPELILEAAKLGNEIHKLIKAKTAKAVTKKPSKPNTIAHPSGLNEMQLKFVHEYIMNPDSATAAYIKAGYKAKGNAAEVNASRLLSNAKVQAEIAKRQEIAAKKNNLTVERLIQELANMVFVDPREFFREDGTMKHVTELSDRAAAAIASIEVEELYAGEGKDKTEIGTVTKLKFWDKNQAVDKAMKHLGQYLADNLQKGAISNMSEEALRAMLERKAKEAGVSVVYH